MMFQRIRLHARGFVYRLLKYPRMWYHAVKAKKNNNFTPTIICNNCTAGFLLHDLQLQFRTPTINTLFYSFDEFMLFVQNLHELQHTSVYPIASSYAYPVGEIKLKGGAIRVGFVHYSSFEDAMTAWKRRFERVNFGNLYVLYEGQITEKEVETFSKLPYPKAILSHKNVALETKYEFYHGFGFYKKWYPGIIGDYKNWFSLQRWLDDFNYIEFLN